MSPAPSPEKWFAVRRTGALSLPHRGSWADPLAISLPSVTEAWSSESEHQGCLVRACVQGKAGLIGDVCQQHSKAWGSSGFPRPGQGTVVRGGRRWSHPVL